MARAKRHYIPGQIWHLTHRCHKRDFLLNLVKDRRRFVQWLFEAKRRYGLTILNYTVTSNHSHLLVVDEKGRDVIPQSIKLVAGRIGQEFNIRKKRKGAFWEDRYHATAVESDQHLLRCIVYIDLNMVRAGVVTHPSEWAFCGYNEIQKPRKKNVLIDHQKLSKLTGFASYDAFRMAHRDLVNDSLTNGGNCRQAQWTESIAVGSKDFLEGINDKLGILAKGRRIIENDGELQLREERGTYNIVFDGKKEDIAPLNAYFLDVIS
jgi:putative transposase